MGFFLVKEIRSKTGELHFRRWRIIETSRFSVYIHGIYKADEDKHMHDHPWDYTRIILSGFYDECFINEAGRQESTVTTPWKIIKRKAEMLHTIRELYTKRVFTLFITGRKRREWGYRVDNQWIDHVTYRRLKNEGRL